ncbi:MAG: YceI family protein [Hyphomonadaceae bacterium]|nr:YceI family protein [Hyphomonadaceae bacterium]
MRAMIATLGSATLLALAGCGQASQTPEAPAAPAAPVIANDAAWALDSQASKIAFASIKAGEVIETHFFPGLSGEVGADGAALVSIPLDQVETKIDIRNERMREMFFETETFPTATISTTVDTGTYSDLAIGERRSTEIEGTLSLHGADAPVYANAFVTRIADDRIEISSAEPVVVYVADFNLEAGLEALREVAGLPSITSAVPVTFTFVFSAQS